VTLREFFFALECSGQAVPPRLLEELASCVLKQIGTTKETISELSAALLKAAAKSAESGKPLSDVQFRVQDGTLEILASCNGGAIWKMSRPIA
jgi:hypothetical protein